MLKDTNSVITALIFLPGFVPMKVCLDIKFVNLVTDVPRAKSIGLDMKSHGSPAGYAIDQPYSGYFWRYIIWLDMEFQKQG